MKLDKKAKILYLRFWLVLLAPGLLASCSGSRHAGNGRAAPRRGYTQTGLGSYYADKFNGRPTASGSTYRPVK